MGVVSLAPRADRGGATERRASGDRAAGAASSGRHAADAERRRPAPAGGQRRADRAARQPVAGAMRGRCGVCGARRRDRSTTYATSVARAAPGCGPTSCGSASRWIPTSLERATKRPRTADVVLVVGTSAVVYPVAALPQMARRRQRKGRRGQRRRRRRSRRRWTRCCAGPASEMLLAVEQQL